MKLHQMLVLSTTLLATSAFADCRLDNPIPLGGKKILATNQAEMITLDHVVFDKAYETRQIPPVDQIANMQMRIFEISWSLDASGDPKPTGWAGVNFGEAGGIEEAGFSFEYGGPFKFEGNTGTNGGVRTYATSVTDSIDSDRTAAAITVEGGALTGIGVTVPVYDRKALPSGGDQLIYRGKDETLCVKSAQLRTE